MSVPSELPGGDMPAACAVPQPEDGMERQVEGQSFHAKVFVGSWRFGFERFCPFPSTARFNGVGFKAAVLQFVVPLNGNGIKPSDRRGGCPWSPI